MGNLAVKFALAVLIINAVISFFNATGVILAPNTVNQVDMSQDTWQQMTDPTHDKEGMEILDIAKQGVYGGGLWMFQFVFGFCYLKGIIDPWVMYTWPFTLATAILQGLIYVVVGLGVIQFISNRRTT